MHTTIDDLQVENDERIAGIAEDLAAVHPTTEARRLAEKVADRFLQDTPGHWQLVASSLTDDPAVLDRFAAEHGLPRPTDAVKATTIAMIRAKALPGANLIPPATERPVCVRVAWLAEDPLRMAHLEYLDANIGVAGEWRPATEAVDTIDPEWCVEIRQTMTLVGA